MIRLLAREKRLAEQARELKRLRAEVARLQARVDSMSQGMRRCVTCEYRLEARERDRD